MTTPAETAAAEGLRRIYRKFLKLGVLTYANARFALIATKGGMAIGCFQCEMVSFNIDDILAKYCSNCHVYHETG